MLDEILGVGDENFRRKSTRVMQEKIRSNKTIVFVSHQTAMIKQLCNRAVWIEEGVSRVEGTPNEVLAEYNKYLSV